MQTSARKLTRDKQINIRATDGGGLGKRKISHVKPIYLQGLHAVKAFAGEGYHMAVLKRLANSDMDRFTCPHSRWLGHLRPEEVHPEYS